MKKNSEFNEIRKKRALDLDILIQKYRNKHLDMEIIHKNEIVDFNRLKTSAKALNYNNSSIVYNRTVSRIGCKISSAPSSPNVNKMRFSPMKTSEKFVINK
jgi:hypothetical protein